MEMALMPNISYQLKNRTANARLVVSGIESPAESFIADPSLPVLFENPFGFPGLREVVIPKGVAVAINGRLVDPETGTKKTVLTIADGTKPYVGIAPYNICKKHEDQMVGNEPSFIRQAYIELPYIPNADDCALVKYGAVHGDINVGDYVMVSKDPNNKGHLTKYDGQDPLTVVGQVVAIEDEAEPWGWFKWVMFDDATKKELYPEPDFARNAVPTENGYPYDPRYRNGVEMSKYRATGIPGLTDGAYRGSQRVPFEIPAGQKVHEISLGTDFGLVANGLVKVYVGGLELPVNQFSVDYENAKITITLPWAADTDLSGYVIVQNKTDYIGTPPGWDYVGAAGVARILIF